MSRRYVSGQKKTIDKDEVLYNGDCDGKIATCKDKVDGNAVKEI